MKQRPTTIPTKALLMYFIWLTLFSTGVSQTTLNFGAKGGLNLATQFGDTYSGLGFRTGILIGGYLETAYNDKFSLQAELNYSQEGARNANFDFSDFSTVIYDLKLKHDYLTAPLLVKYQVMEKLNIQSGLQLGLRVVSVESRIIKSGTPSFTDRSAGARSTSGRYRLVYPEMFVGAEYKIIDRVKAQFRFFFSVFDKVKNRAGDSEGTYPVIFQFSASYEIFKMDFKGIKKP